MCENDVKDTQPLLGNTSQAHYSSYIQSSSWSGASDLHDDEEKLKKKLQWYFKNPYEKYQDRGRKPYKLLLQIVKIILVTTQVSIWSLLKAFSNKVSLGHSLMTPCFKLQPWSY